MERGSARVSGADLHRSGAPRLPLTLVSGFGPTMEDQRLAPSRGEEGSLRLEGIHLWRISWHSKFLHEFVSSDDYGAISGLNGNGGCPCLVILWWCMVASLFPSFWRWSSSVEGLKPSRGWGFSLCPLGGRVISFGSGCSGGGWCIGDSCGCLFSAPGVGMPCSCFCQLACSGFV
eukprot:Gb_21803 [translate_table: standard]